MAEVDFDEFGNDPSPGLGSRLTRLANLAGALVSVGLIAGLAVWGYRLTVRDVTGVPVIRALEGSMRIAPEEPGGELASYQGLAVNRVAAEGEAAPPPDRLVLAPRPTSLADEDMTAADIRAAATPDAAEDTQIAAAVEEAVELVEEGAADEIAQPAPAPEPPVEQAAVIGAPVRLSPDLRPMPRPARVLRAAAAAPVTPPPAAAASSAPEEIEPSRLRAGAPLVQLGAFDDPETARKEWQRLSSKFATYMTGKSRVVQEAESGGRRFYRLRAAGFADEAEARRFCSALLAEQAACIPVAQR